MRGSMTMAYSAGAQLAEAAHENWAAAPLCNPIAEKGRSRLTQC